MTMRVHHIAISTAHFERLRTFYVETLGLAVVGGFADQKIVFLDAGGVTLELVGDAATDRPSAPGFDRRGWQHLAWEVEDVTATYADWLARGVIGHSPPEDFPSDAPRLRIAFLRDPDGNLLELVQTLSPSAVGQIQAADSGSARSR